MLALTRRVGEVILIGPNIKITVIEIRGSQVKLGIEAPNDTAIWRKELVDASGQVNPIDLTKSRSGS